MATERNKMMQIIQENYPKLSLRTTEEFDGSTDGIWVSGTEDRNEAKDGFSLFDYYSQDYAEKRYIFGVHKEIREILEQNGWYGQWHDAGTMMFWEA